MAIVWPVATSQPPSVCASLHYLHLCVFLPSTRRVQRSVRVSPRPYASLSASSTHATLRYLNWRQLGFQATIKSPPWRAVIWQETNAPATVGALRGEWHMRPPVSQVWQGLIAQAPPPPHRLSIMSWPALCFLAAVSVGFSSNGGFAQVNQCLNSSTFNYSTKGSVKGASLSISRPGFNM